MTGPENYSEAERLLALAVECDAGSDTHAANARRTEALVRAVLALAAGLAAHAHPESIAWEQAINPTEAP